jgi:hypothetical protein
MSPTKKRKKLNLDILNIKNGDLTSDKYKSGFISKYPFDK